jgi:hypothetical protein
MAPSQPAAQIAAEVHQQPYGGAHRRIVSKSDQCHGQPAQRGEKQLQIERTAQLLE